MSRLPRQTASMLLIAVLGCGTAVTAICQVLCVESPAAPLMQTAAGLRHHHRMPQASPQDDRSAVGNRGFSTGIHAIAHASAPRDCCATLAAPPSAAVLRADVAFVPPSDAAMFAWLCEASTSDIQFTRHSPGSPPGGFSPARTPLVLRV